MYVEKINMISAISNQGRCHFLCYEENMTQQRFIDFMERLVKDTDRKVLFIVDNLKVHHGKTMHLCCSVNGNAAVMASLIPVRPSEQRISMSFMRLST